MDFGSDNMAVVNVIYLSELSGTTGKRIDAEYYAPDSVEAERLLKNSLSLTLRNFGVNVDASAFYPSIAEYYQDSGIPFVRVSDVTEGSVKRSDIIFLSEDLVDKFSAIRQALPGDMVITKGGTVGTTALLSDDSSRYALCRDLIVVRSSVLPIRRAISIMLFLISKYGRFQLLRGKSQQVQPHLTIPLVKNLLVPDLAMENAVDCYLISTDYFKKAESLYSQAENMLLEELGLRNLQPKYEFSYTASLSKAFGARRVDAEYFQPSYENLTRKLTEAVVVKPLKYFLLDIKKGIEVGGEQYQEKGKPFIRVSNLSVNGLIEREQKYIDETLYAELAGEYEPRVGELLLTKDATPGIAYVLKEPIKGVIAGGILRLTVDETRINKEYLALCINSLIGKLQIERDGGGSVIKHWRPEQIKKLTIPLLPRHTQQGIGSLVQQSHEARRKAKDLLEEAKRKVEEAVEAASV